MVAAADILGLPALLETLSTKLPLHEAARSLMACGVVSRFDALPYVVDASKRVEPGVPTVAIDEKTRLPELKKIAKYLHVTISYRKKAELLDAILAYARGKPIDVPIVAWEHARAARELESMRGDGRAISEVDVARRIYVRGRIRAKEEAERSKDQEFGRRLAIEFARRRRIDFAPVIRATLEEIVPRYDSKIRGDDIEASVSRWLDADSKETDLYEHPWFFSYDGDAEKSALMLYKYVLVKKRLGENGLRYSPGVWRSFVVHFEYDMDWLHVIDLRLATVLRSEKSVCSAVEYERAAKRKFKDPL
jgi:hypothetical protein